MEGASVHVQTRFALLWTVCKYAGTVKCGESLSLIV